MISPLYSRPFRNLRLGWFPTLRFTPAVLSLEKNFIIQHIGLQKGLQPSIEANGKNRTATVDELFAGDIGVTVKLKSSHTNESLVQKGTEIEVEKMSFPSHRFRTAIAPPSKGDMEKIMKALHQIEEEDPTLEVEQSATLKQTILHGQGQLHLDLIKYRVEKVNNLELAFEKPKIPYRETITTRAEDHYRHKKQSGGSGQFAEVHMRIEPYYVGMPEPDGLNVRNAELVDLEWGGTLAFYWCIVGGSIDAKYSNAIKKGVIQKMEEGPLTGSRCQDIRVCIYDGKMHSVDSNDMAFMIAASQVFKNAFVQARPQLMEPIYDLEILCSDTVMGDIMGDLQTRRAMIQGMTTEGHYQKISAKVPLAELYKYSSTLRSISQGRAKFTRKFAEFASVPPDIQNKLTKSHAEAEAAIEGKKTTLVFNLFKRVMLDNRHGPFLVNLKAYFSNIFIIYSIDALSPFAYSSKVGMTS